MTTHIKKFPNARKVVDPDHPQLELKIEAEVEREGIGMGVLSDGTPFLNQRAIGDLCGVRNKYIGIISSEWTSNNPSKEVRRVKELVYEQAGSVPLSPHVEVWEGKKRYLAYPDTICTAILEYFAFEAKRQYADIALTNYRRLSRFGLKQFIYKETGYTGDQEDDLWRVFKDRVSLTYDSVPAGYFGVFKELSDLIVTLGMKGLHINEGFVPDISVGQAWARFWKDRDLGSEFGSRRTYPHHFPDYFPQAASNPQLANCYPEYALGEFRRWFREEYIGEGKFKRYLSGKAKGGKLPNGYVEGVMVALLKE